jgi:hypothetical protein
MIGFDATTQEGVLVNVIYISYKNIIRIVDLQELAGGTSLDYSTQIVECIDRLASVYSLCNGLVFKDVKDKMLSNISCTMTDRAAVNNATIQVINSFLNHNLIQLNCNLHPLDSIASKCKSVLTQLQVNGGGGFKSNFLGMGVGLKGLHWHSTNFGSKMGRGIPMG